MDQRVGSRSGKGHKSGSTKETRASEPEQKETIDVPFWEKIQEYKNTHYMCKYILYIYMTFIIYI